MVEDSDGIQQAVFMDREDLISLLNRLEQGSFVQYLVCESFYKERRISGIDSIIDLDCEIKLGFSMHGQACIPDIGLQFQPNCSLPIRKTRGGYVLDLPRAGIPILSPGGLYEKTKELISGRIAFTLWIRNDKEFDFRKERLNYERVLKAFMEIGAQKHGLYLIGPSAYSKFEQGVPLVYQTGGQPLQK